MLFKTFPYIGFPYAGIAKLGSYINYFKSLTFHLIKRISPKLIIAVIKRIIPIGIPISITCPNSNCPGAMLIVATAVEKADIRPSISPGTSFCINVKVNTFDNDRDSIIAIPLIPKIPARV